MRGEPILAPVLIDDPALRALADAGYRWKEGRAGAVLYRWLLPPDWLLAAELPARQANGIEPLCGGGDRAGRFSAVLTLLRGCDEPPAALVARGASPGARMGTFQSPAGQVAERLESKGGQSILTAAHAFTAGGESHRFLIAALAAGHDAETQRRLRLLGVALALHDELAGALAGARLGGRLHG